MNEPAHPLNLSELYDVLYYAPFGVLVEDCEGNVVWLNHTLQWQLGVDAGEVVGRRSGELPLEPMAGARGKRLFRIPTAGEQSGVGRLKCIEDVLPQYSETGIRVRYFMEAMAHDPEPRFRNDLLRLMVNRPVVDKLTGLQDRDGIVSTLRSEVSRSRRYGNPLSIVLLEIATAAGTGTVIDHPSRTMAVASALLKNSTRWADSIGRFEASEFLLVLPETTAVAAQKLARKIDTRIEEHNSTPDAAAFAARFGVVEWGRGDDESVLLRRGRQALSQSAVV